MVTAFGPGRVNLIGEHTDYNDGLALPFAIGLGVTVTAEAIDGDEVEASARGGETDRFPLADPPRDGDDWRAFVHGAVGELTAAGHTLTAARLTIDGDIPEGSGLSSSAGLEVALTLALLELANAEEPGRVALAKLCSRIENDWVGAHTGLLDQLASLLGREGHALRIDFRTLAVEHVPLALGEHRLVCVDSGETHRHAAGGYNERREELAEAQRLLHLDSLRDATLAAANDLPDPLARRVRHTITENARVDATVDALGRGDLAAVGALLDASHASLRDDYDASTAAVERTVAALKDGGALGARMVGGGFGGQVLALLPPGAPLPPEAIDVAPAPGARVIRR